MEYTLKGKTALVIGGGRGIGRAIATALAREGANLVLAARTQSELAESAGEIGKLGVDVRIVPADAATEEGMARIGKGARAVNGQVDILVNTTGEAILKPLAEVTMEDWKRSIDENVTTVFLGMREFLPEMLERKSGQIINLSSLSGFAGSPNGSAYGTAKAGTIALSRIWSKEAKKYGVKVLAIAPGPIDSPMRWAVMPGYDTTRTLSPETIAEFVLFILARPEFTFGDCVTPMSLNYAH